MPDSYGNPFPWEAQAPAMGGYGTGAGMNLNWSAAPPSFMGTGAGLNFGGSAPAASSFDWGSLSGNGQVTGFNSGNPAFGNQVQPAAKPGFWGEGGFNIGSVGTIAQGIGALSSAYLGYKNYGLAKDQLNFTKMVSNTNLNNSIKAYNNSLEDRIRGRTSAHAGKDAEDNAYLASHSMTR